MSRFNILVESLFLLCLMIGGIDAFLSANPAFVTKPQQQKQQSSISRFMVPFSMDGSEYSSKDSDYLDDDTPTTNDFNMKYDDDEDEIPTVEEQPVPMSKNSGNRFVAIVWDQDVDNQNRDALDLHLDRDELIEDHVMFCRKRNLYNETFNTDSMVDILRSLPILSSDLLRVVGHALILESTDIKYVREMLQEEPILQGLNGGDLSDVQLYRWRHIRDYTLRIDDGRDGYPCMMVALDEDAENLGGTSSIRQDVKEEFLKYLVKSERVIMAGPLYMPTELKDDPSSIAMGDFILFNAKDRDDAIQFVEDMPTAAEGLYKDLRVHFYNQLDITGKFVSEDPSRDAPGTQMQEALEYWGYPTGDDQTPWLNW